MDHLILAFDFVAFAIIFVLTAGIYLWMVRKTYYTVFDPLFLTHLFSVFSISFVIYSFLVEKNINGFYFRTFCFAILSFIIGLKCGNYFSRLKVSPANDQLIDINSSMKKEALLTEILLWLSIVVLYVSNGFLFLLKGQVPILSDDPSSAKVFLYTGGFGVIKRLNVLFLNVGISICFIKIFFVSKHNKVSSLLKYIFALFLLILIGLSTGSKSSLAVLLSAIFFIYYFLSNISRATFIDDSSKTFALNSVKRIKSLFLYLIPVLFFNVLLVFYLSAGGESNVLLSLFIRLMVSGDVFHIFYSYDVLSEFNYNFFDYLAYIFNPLTGLLRLTPYEVALGSQVFEAAFNVDPEGFGPNSQHVIEGLVFFGNFFWLYSFTIGLIVTSVRNLSLYFLKKNPDQLKLLVFIFLAVNLCGLPIDVTVFTSNLTDFFVFGSVIFIVSLLIKEVLLSSRKLSLEIS